MAAKFPTSIATLLELLTAKNNINTTLVGAHTDVVTTITVVSTTGFPTAGDITIGSEVITYTGTTATTFTGATRGADGTSNVAHSDSDPVSMFQNARYHGVLADEIRAIAQNLKVVQIIESSNSTDFTTTSNVYQTTNAAATITPKSTSNKILVIATGGLISDDISAASAIATLFRDAVDLLIGGNGGFASIFYTGAGGTAFGGHVTGIKLDSPASVSALTYSVKIKNSDNVTQIRLGNARATGITLIELSLI